MEEDESWVAQGLDGCGGDGGGGVKLRGVLAVKAPKSSRAGERRGDSEGSRAEKSSGVQRTG